MTTGSGTALWVRALLSFLALPGIVAFVVPMVLLSIDPWRGAGSTAGAVILLAGLVILLWCVRDFYISGKGTLAPWDPPCNLVVVGLYRYTRNPMYVGVLTLVAGWCAFAGSPLTAAYAAVLFVAFHARVLRFEEPWLAKTFGAEWTRYASAVPRWLPRLTPWSGDGVRET